VISNVTLNDSGLTHELGPTAVPSLRGTPLLLLALMLAMTAIVWLRIRQLRNRGDYT